MKIEVFYDGDCPFCSAYVVMTELRRRHDVSLNDLRENPDKVREFRELGYDVDEGMIVMVDEKIFYGDEGFTLLTNLAVTKNFLAKLMLFVFSSRRFNRVAYPVLRKGRNITLRLMGRPKL